MSQTVPSPIDIELVIRAQQGDKEAFGDLYERHLNAIYHYIYYRLHNIAEAEDLTEVVFIKAWQGLKKYEDQGVPFLAWLYRIARNVVIDHHRQQKMQWVDIEEQYTLPDEQTNLPDEAVEVQLDTEHVLRCLNQLDSAQKEVLLLRFVDGLNHEETAEMMSRTAVSVRVLQHRALKALQALLRRSS